MRKLSLALALPLLVLGPALGAPAPGAAISPEARAVLERAVESMGGDAALAAVKGMRTTYQGTYRAGEMPPMPYASTLVWQAPDRILWKLDAGVFQAAGGASGETFWMAFMAPPARVRGPVKESIREWLLMNDLLLVRPLLHREDVKIGLEGAGKEGEARTETLRVEFADGHRYTLVFRSGTGGTSLVTVEGDMTNWDGRRGTLKVGLSAPRAFGAITYPTKLAHETRIDGKLGEEMEEEVTALEWNPELPEGAFAMPKLEIPLGKPAVKKVPARTALVLAHRGPRDRLGETMKKAYRICMEAKLLVAGAATALYRNDAGEVEGPAELLTDVALPVMLMGPAPPDLPGGAAIRSIPGAEVAAMTVRGPYGTVEGPGLAKLETWLEAQGRERAGLPRIAYLHNPEGTVPEDQLAELQIPVR